jgi:hypothetical protein
MTTLKVHTIESAPGAASKPLLEASQSIRNDSGLHGVLAAPGILEGPKLHELFVNTSFNEELTVVSRQ